jgi:hypothetical protein
MAKAGRNVKFLRDGITFNGRVYVNGEIDTQNNVFKNGTLLNAEEQLETYGVVFYEVTDEDVTDPRTHVARVLPTEVKVNPQMAEANAPRSDGAGVSEVGNPHRTAMASAQTTRYEVKKGEALSSQTPLLPLDQKELKKERIAEGTLLKFNFKKNQGGRPKKLVDAKATPLATTR